LLVATRRSGPPRLRRRLWALAVVTAAQGLIGYVQIFTGLPEVLVGAHMLGAALLTVATTYVYLGLRERDVTPPPASALSESSSHLVGGSA